MIELSNPATNLQKAVADLAVFSSPLRRAFLGLGALRPFSLTGLGAKSGEGEAEDSPPAGTVWDSTGDGGLRRSGGGILVLLESPP